MLVLPCWTNTVGNKTVTLSQRAFTARRITRGRSIICRLKARIWMSIKSELRKKINKSDSESELHEFSDLSGSLICTHQLQLGNWLWASLNMFISPREPLCLVFVWCVQYVCLRTGSVCLRTHVYPSSRVAAYVCVCVWARGTGSIRKQLQQPVQWRGLQEVPLAGIQKPVFAAGAPETKSYQINIYATTPTLVRSNNLF